MDFEGADPQAILQQMRKSERVFHDGMTELFKVDNYDNHLPSGLAGIWKFFNAHREEIYSGEYGPDALYRLFLRWGEAEALR